MAINKLISTTLLIPFIFLSALSFAETEEEQNDRGDDLDQANISLEKRIDYIDNWTRSNISGLRKRIDGLIEDYFEKIKTDDRYTNEVIKRLEAERKEEQSERINILEATLSAKIYHEAQRTDDELDEITWNTINYLLVIIAIALTVGVIILTFLSDRILRYLSTEVGKEAKDHIFIYGRMEQATIHDIHAQTAHSDSLRASNEDDRLFYLERAIYFEELAEKALKPNVEKAPEEFRYIWARVNNNLAIFLLDMNDDKYYLKAKQCAKFAYEISKEEPTTQGWHHWQDTYLQVLLKSEDSNDQINAQQLFENICNNPAIDDLSWKKRKFEEYKGNFD